MSGKYTVGGKVIVIDLTGAWGRERARRLGLLSARRSWSTRIVAAIRRCAWWLT